MIYVEFGWNSDVYLARQIVNERIATVLNRMPAGVKPELAPISSIMESDRDGGTVQPGWHNTTHADPHVRRVGGSATVTDHSRSLASHSDGGGRSSFRCWSIRFDWRRGTSR